MKWEDLESFFCRGALATYAGNAEPILSPLSPGAKIYIYTEEDLQYTDVYYAHRTGDDGLINLSGGQTAITFGQIPLWQMSYDGWHLRLDGVKEFLIEALCENYKKGVFLGGRGPESYQPEGSRFNYSNQTNDWAALARQVREGIPFPSFRAFAGDDAIYDHERCSMMAYYHRFCGKALVQILP